MYSTQIAEFVRCSTEPPLTAHHDGVFMLLGQADQSRSSRVELILNEIKSRFDLQRDSQVVDVLRVETDVDEFACFATHLAELAYQG